jgi:tRNA(Arg) A34 adenosine deaminase TadA
VIYVSAEPCVYCCYAIRESRIGRVVYGLHSPHYPRSGGGTCVISRAPRWKVT